MFIRADGRACEQESQDSNRHVGMNGSEVCVKNLKSNAGLVQPKIGFLLQTML